MKDAIAFVIAVPLTVEMFGAMYAVFDAWRDRNSRSAALERLAVPLAAWVCCGGGLAPPAGRSSPRHSRRSSSATSRSTTRVAG